MGMRSLDLRGVEISSTATSAEGTAPLPMKGVWSTIRSYILWQHERGTLHYDIMVTLILIFVFFSPRVINFNDKPAPLSQHPTGVLVTPDGAGGLVYQIDAATLTAGDETATSEQLRRIIEPISGDIAIAKYETVTNSKGRVEGYRVW
jgi:hypothetical protein